jgi:hypothetical protein
LLVVLLSRQSRRAANIFSASGSFSGECQQAAENYFLCPAKKKDKEK